MPKNVSNSGTTGAFTSKQGTVWLQPNGCGSPMVQVGCVQFDELAVSRGDTTSILCFNPSDRSRFYKVGETLTAPEDSEFDLMSYIGAQTTWLDWLYKQKCSYPLYVLIRCTVNGHGVPTGWERAISINGASATTYTLANLATRNEDNAAEATLTLKASPADISILARPKITTHEVDYAAGLSDITFAGDTNCGGPCGDPQRDCETGFVIGIDDGTNGPVISKMKTDCIGWEIVEDSGGDPSAPFLDGEIAISLLASLKTGYPRLIAVRGTLRALTPAEIAFSDDGGVTWSNVIVGSVDEQIGSRKNCLTQSENGDLWFATTGGYIYTSQDNGAVWIEREAGVLMTGDDLQAIHFRDAVYGLAAGEAGKILVTQDAGEHWFLLPPLATPDDLGRYTPTSAAIRVITSLGRNWYIGTDAGELWRTIDFKTWYKIAFSGQLSGNVTDLQFYNGCTGVLLFNEGGGRGRVMYTIDGANFEPLETPPNNGLFSVEMLGETEFYIVGAAHNGHGVVLKGTAYPAA
jgi:hypothetical protein